MQSRHKKLLIYAAALLVISLCGFWFFQPRFDDSWKELTTPLPQDRISILCRNFELKRDDRLCNNHKDVYGPDFIDVIERTIRPSELYRAEDNHPAQYDEVEEMLGQFRTECESVIKEGDGFEYFVCDYDLRGDGIYIIGIFYEYPAMTAFRITMSMGND